MNAHNNMETQLWEYIDGLSGADERSFIEGLIATDAEWRKKYDELLSFNAALHQDIEIDQPSMRFTRNVMEEIGRHQIAPATGSYINKKIIYGIAGFFLTLIVGFLIYAIGQIDWSVAPANSTLPFNLPKIDTSKVFNNNYVNAFMIVNIVLGLMLLDRYLAQQRKHWKKEDA
jgi:hypothetical protein